MSDKSYNCSVNIKCEVTEENRNIIKQVFLRSFVGESDSIMDNGVFVVVKKKSGEMKGVFRINITPLPGAKGYSVQIQADYDCGFILYILGMSLLAFGILTTISGIFPIGIPAIITGILLMIIGFVSSNESYNAMGKQLNDALNQVASFFK